MIVSLWSIILVDLNHDGTNSTVFSMDQLP